MSIFKANKAKPAILVNLVLKNYLNLCYLLIKCVNAKCEIYLNEQQKKKKKNKTILVVKLLLLSEVAMV